MNTSMDFEGKGAFVAQHTVMKLFPREEWIQFTKTNGK